MAKRSKMDSVIEKKAMGQKISISIKKKELIPKIHHIVKNKIIASDFEPSMKILQRIAESMLKGTENKTRLSLNANLNYARLAKHIVWLEKKGLVESIIEDSRINIGLTESGKLFALTILK